MEREPGWYWVKLLGWDWVPCDYCYEETRGRMMVADGSRFYDLSEVAEWGPRIPTPDEPALPPAKVRDESVPPPGFSGPWASGVGEFRYRREWGYMTLTGAWAKYDSEHGYAPAGGDERVRELLRGIKSVAASSRDTTSTASAWTRSWSCWRVGRDEPR